MNRHLGMCDASCAVPLMGTRFLVADDERNVLCVYDAAASGQALQTLALDDLLGEPSGEVDLEGAATLGEVVYWISSHGRTRKGKKDRERYVFVASRVTDNGDTVTIRRVGQPVTDLLDSILEHPGHRGMGLEGAEKRSPKDEGGLNIEGLTASPQGGLLIGFRSPLVGDNALAVHLLNPAEAVQGRTPVFGEPRLLDLKGLGVRSLEYWGERELLLVVAGPVDGGGDFRLYAVDARGGFRTLPIRDGFAAEAAVTFRGESYGLLLLSDDGALIRSGKKAKKHPPQHPDRYFRSYWVMDV